MPVSRMMNWRGSWRRIVAFPRLDHQGTDRQQRTRAVCRSATAHGHTYSRGWSRANRVALRVFAFAFFDHVPGQTRTFQTPNGRTVTAGPTSPWTWELAELFKVENGLLHEVEAVLERAPYGMGSGWSTWEQAMSSDPRQN